MKKTLQDQYLLIKEGKGHKDVFIKEAKQQFPGLIRNAATYTEVANVLKTKNIINENVIGLEPINQLQSSKKESYEVAFENFLAEAKKEYFDDEKAEVKKPSKQVEEDAEKNFDYEDKKNPDNLIFDQIMKGYYTEMKDPKNENKTMEQLKAIVIKNLEKNPTYYTEKGQFGVKDLGYTMDAPGLGEPKEPKGKYKSSGYGNLNEVLHPDGIDYFKKLEKEYPDLNLIQALKKEGSHYAKMVLRALTGINFKEGLINEEDQVRKAVRSIINEELNEMDTTKPGDILMFRGESMKVLDIDDVGNHKLEDKTGRVRMYNLSQIKQGTFTPEKREITTVELNEQKVKEIIKENVHKELAEINKLAEYEVFELKLNKINELIEKKSSFLERINEDEDMKALTDKKKVKELQKEVKILERAKAKIEKALAKKAKSTPKKKEIIDEDEPIEEAELNEAPPSEDTEKIKTDSEEILKNFQDMEKINLEELGDDYTENEIKAIDIAKAALSSSPSLDPSSLARPISQKPEFPEEERARIEDTLMGYDFYSNI